VAAHIQQNHLRALPTVFFVNTSTSAIPKNFNGDRSIRSVIGRIRRPIPDRSNGGMM
jgi:hypothetical protein